jgi:hypothetical protein
VLVSVDNVALVVYRVVAANSTSIVRVVRILIPSCVYWPTIQIHRRLMDVWRLELIVAAKGKAMQDINGTSEYLCISVI